MVDVETVEPGKNYQEHYLAKLREYEDEISKLKEQESLIARDVITAADEERYVQAHLQDERQMIKNE